MPTKISKVAKELNVGFQTLLEYLEKKNMPAEQNSPNVRISDEQYEVLMKAFNADHDAKKRAESQAEERQKERKSNQAVNSNAKVEELTTQVKKPKFLGKIDLATGKPIETKVEATPAAPVAEEVAEQPVAEPKQEAKPQNIEQPVAKQAEEPVVEKPAEKPAEVKVEEKPAEKPAAPVAEPKQEPQPQVTLDDETGAELDADDEPYDDRYISNDNDDADDDDEVFKLSTPSLKTSINVVGKIDLSQINSQTRPKKKTKEEKRNERMAKNAIRQEQHGGEANGEGNRKKRKRIGGKEKVDIEKSANQIQNDGRKGGDKNQGNNSKRDKNQGKNQKPKRPLKPEVSEEDVQRQVKETLARLTTKTQNKGAKWRKEKREAVRENEREMAEQEAKEEKILKLTEFVTANDLAMMMDVPINKVIGTCMSLGVMVSINQRLDAETINIVAEEFGFKTQYVSADIAEAIQVEEDTEDQLVERPPVVTVMGHVDHGKTSLLDYVRKSNVIAGEAGGITQHIGAYNVKLSNGRRITFLDTPGHEAFTAMRARGAEVTDIVIIIVAADDSVMPQTVEAINHASAAGVPIVFAINKIDKPSANPDQVKTELANMNYLVEEWGGKYQSQDISAKKGIGVDELMEKVLLEADLLELKANPNRNAVGSIIESSLDKGRGYVATVLVQNGTLRVGDNILAGTHFGKVKAMFNERNQRVKEAGPSSPVLVLGLNGAPTAGDKFNVMDTEQEVREIAGKREQLQREQGLKTQKRITLEDIGRRKALGSFHELNIIVKTDVAGSYEALSDSLLKLSTPEVQVNVIHKAVGAISESDVTLASASDAYIIGFQVRPTGAAKKLAEQEGVDIRTYSVIYDAIEEVKQAMEGMLSPDIKEEVTGTAEVLQTYRISKVGTIAGAMVRTGKIKRTCKVRVIRDGIVRYTGELGSLKRFKDDAKEVTTGFDCGLSVAGYNDIVEGDIIEAFEEIEVKKKI
ncbi:MAG: translation initiation factor IF-2 [Muribaculaceae bacterium]